MKKDEKISEWICFRSFLFDFVSILIFLMKLNKIAKNY